MTVVLDRAADLDLAVYRRVVDERELVELAPAALERVVAGRDVLSGLLDRGIRVYGVNTGLGYLHGAGVDKPDGQEGLQRALLTARSCGACGPALRDTRGARCHAACG